MKQLLPQNVLLFIALAATGAILLYNTVIRESYATTLRYAYPAAGQQAEAAEPSTAKEASRAEAVESAPEETETAQETDPGTEPETETEPAAATDGEAVTGVQFPLDVNTATVEEILLIPDVTSAVAQRIVQYREHLGGAYTDLAELQNISGVGETTYEKLWAHFYISGEEAADAVRFPLDVNTATVEEILLIPDVTSAVAQRIVQYREHLGGAYTDLAELRNISGVGEATYNKLWAHFYISEDGEPYGQS